MVSPVLSPPTRRLLALLGPERGRWMLVGGLMSASALGEVAAPYVTGRVTERVTQEDATAAVWPLVLVGMGSAITELACDTGAAMALSRARQRLQRGAVTAVLRGAVPGGRLGDTPAAVAERLTGDSEAAQAALAEVLVPGLWAVTRAVALLAAVAWLSPLLGLLTALLLPLLLLLPRKVAAVQQDLARQVQAAEASSSAVALEALQAVGTVRAFGHEAGVTRRVRQGLARGHRLRQREALLYAGGLWASGFPALALKVALLLLGGHLVASGTVTPGELVSVLMCQLHFTRAVQALLLYLPGLGKAIGSCETLLELLEEAKTAPPSGPVSPVTHQGDKATGTRGLCLRDVWMSYPGRAEPVLKGVSLSLRPGELLAVLAPPGGGKSSLAAAALGLRPLAGGAVLLDGTPLTPCSDPTLRRQVAGVPQCPSILSRSLGANITLGWGHQEVTPGVVAVAQRVGVHSWAQRLPHGYDTEVGPRGMQLSGGQAQGVALARALLRTPQVLVLDEPTRSLDPVTRHQVEQELLCPGPGEGPAVLLVTGRVALAQRAQRVALLEGGRLRELGTPEELKTLPWRAAGGDGDGEGDTENGEGSD